MMNLKRMHGFSCLKCLFCQQCKSIQRFGSCANSASRFVSGNSRIFQCFGANTSTTGSRVLSGRGQSSCLILVNRHASISSVNRKVLVRNLTGQPAKTEPPAPHFPVVDRLHELEEKWRVRGYSVLRWGLGLVLAGMATLYMFREQVRENVADEVADVASRSLGDESVVNQVNEMTKLVLQDTINDPETTKLASNFIMSVLNRDDVRAAAVQLTLFVLKDPNTQAKVSELAAQTLREMITKPDVRMVLLGYIKGLILDDSTKEVCKELLQHVLQDPGVKEFMSESLGNLVASSVVKNKAVELGKNITHEVVSDIEIQKETGDALWTVMKKTVTPSWFSSE